MKNNKEIKTIIEEAVKENVFPSACVGVYRKKKNNFNKSITISSNYYDKKNIDTNKDLVFYDIASLTKPLSTVLSFLSLKREGKIKEDDMIGDIFDVKDIPTNKTNNHHPTSFPFGRLPSSPTFF